MAAMTAPLTREQVAERLMYHGTQPSAWLLDQVLALLAEASAPQPPSGDAMEAARAWWNAHWTQQDGAAIASLAALLTAREDAVRAQERERFDELVARRDKHIALQDACALAAGDLLCACDQADAVEELPGEVDGSFMDAVRWALIVMYPECSECKGRGGDEDTDILCSACRGLCVVMPPRTAASASATPKGGERE